MVVMLKEYFLSKARQGPTSWGNLQIWGISGETGGGEIVSLLIWTKLSRELTLSSALMQQIWLTRAV